MSNENKTAIGVRGERREHPAIGRLARACIALVRWRRQLVATTDSADQRSVSRDDAPSSRGDQS